MVYVPCWHRVSALTEHHHLSEEERVRIGMQADAIIRVLADRYGLEPGQVIEAVRWVEHHKEFVTSLKKGGLLSLFGVLITATMLAMWEGAKVLFRIKAS